MININVLYFQILELKNADTENVLLHFTFPIKILLFFLSMRNLMHLLKICSMVLSFLGIFDMARLYVVFWALMFPRFTKFQEKKHPYQGALSLTI